MVCLVRIDELLSSSGPHSLRATPVSKTRVAFATHRPHPWDVFPNAVQVGIDLNPKRDPIYGRNDEMNRSKYSFHFFDPTGRLLIAFRAVGCIGQRELARLLQRNLSREISGQIRGNLEQSG